MTSKQQVTDIVNALEELMTIKADMIMEKKFSNQRSVLQSQKKLDEAKKNLEEKFEVALNNLLDMAS